MASRLRTIDRLVGLIRLVESRHLLPPVSVLAEQYGVCERTIRRDLAVIETVLPVNWRGRRAA